MKGTMHDDIPLHMHNPFFTTNFYTATYILFIDDLLNDADGFFQFIPRDIERRQEAQEAISGEN